MTYGYSIYFTERLRNRVMAWSPDSGELAVCAGGADRQNGDALREPYGIAVDERNRVLIADKLHGQIRRLEGGRLTPVATRDVDGHRSALTPNHRDAPSRPTGLFALKDGRILATFEGDHTVYLIHADGRLEHLLGIVYKRFQIYRGHRDVIQPTDIESSPLMKPTAIVMDADGTIFFIERDHQNVREYRRGSALRSLFPGAQRRHWTTRRDIPDEIPVKDYHPGYPTGLALDHSGRLYLSDATHRCVWQFDRSREVLRKIVATGGSTVSGSGPAAIAFGSDGTLWISDYGEGRVHGVREETHGAWNPVEGSVMTDRESVWTTIKSQGAGISCGPLHKITNTNAMRSSHG
jgi:sugar lactone lactonase YvrE